jgi:hypothetical protein
MAWSVSNLSPRVAFLISLVLAGASVPFNVLFLLYSWKALASMAGRAFADNSDGLVFLAALLAHLGLYVVVLLLVLPFVRQRAAYALSITILGAGVVYSVAIVGVLMLTGMANLP